MILAKLCKINYTVIKLYLQMCHTRICATRLVSYDTLLRRLMIVERMYTKQTGKLDG